MRAKATVRLGFASERRLCVVRRALEPEIRNVPTMRSHATLRKEGEFLVLSVEAEDTVALRAAVNAYLRWINSTVNVLEVLEKL
jgi:KEOPS complex subunit Pcc1